MGRPRRSSVRLTVAFAIALLAASALYAQQIWVGRGIGSFDRSDPVWAAIDDFDGSFIFCRGYYDQVRYEDGGMGWWTDYPGADNNLLVRIAELTTVGVNLDEHRQPKHVVVELTDPLLFRCPMLIMEDVGTLEFDEDQVASLREYFRKGGFLWVDDFWGSRAWSHWARNISRVLPPGEFPIFDIPVTHPIMSALYDIKAVPQVPSINFWSGGWAGTTSERGVDSRDVHFRGIQDGQGRLMVLMSHNTDIADTWEREGEHQEYFDLFSPAGYAVGVNTVIYSMTH